MPSSPLALFAGITEVLLVLLGLYALWRQFFGAKRGDKQEPAAWDCSPLHVGILVWLVLVSGLLIQFAMLGAFSWLKISQDERLILASAGFQVGLLSGCLAFIFYTSPGKSYALPRLPFLKEGFFTFLGVLPLIFGAGLAWTGILHRFGVQPERQDLLLLMQKQGSGSWLAVMIVMAVLVAPFAEELIFRAGLYRFLRSRVPYWLALALPALLFAALHANLASFPQLLVLGVFFALAYERTGNIAVPIFAHALFNLNTILMLLSGLDA